MGKSHNLATYAGGVIADDVELGGNTDISMDANASGQVRIDGNGYHGAIALGSTAMNIYHNSGSRNLSLGTNETARLTIDASGRVTMPYQPSFLAYNAPTISSSAYRIYSQTLFNIGNAYSTSTGRFTAPVAGRYMFTFSDLITTPSTTTYAYTRPYLNAGHYTITVHTSYNSTRSYEPLGGTFVADMNVNDYMQIYTVISGSSTYGGTYTWFSGHLLG